MWVCLTFITSSDVGNGKASFLCPRSMTALWLLNMIAARLSLGWRRWGAMGRQLLSWSPETRFWQTKRVWSSHDLSFVFWSCMLLFVFVCYVCCLLFLFLFLFFSFLLSLYRLLFSLWCFLNQLICCHGNNACKAEVGFLIMGRRKF